MLKWVAFAEAFPLAIDTCIENLKRLNDELSDKSVLLGNGLKPSEVDVLVFSVIHSSLVCTFHIQHTYYAIRRENYFPFLPITKTDGQTQVSFVSNGSLFFLLITVHLTYINPI